MPKYPGISPYDNEKGTLGTAKKRWEKIYVKEIESDTISGMDATIDYLATTAENSVTAAVQAKNAAESAQTAAENAAETAATAAAGIQSVVETDVDSTLSIPGVAADAKVTGDWLDAIARPVTLDTSMTSTAFADEYMKCTVDAEDRVLYGVKRDGTFTWQKGVPKHLQDKINELAAPTINNDEYMYVMLDSDQHVLFGVKKDGSFDWQKGVPKPVKEKLEEVAQTVIDSEEFVQLTQDADGKIIEGVLSDGTKKFGSPVRFGGGVKWSNEDIEDIERELSNISSSFFNYKPYITTLVGDRFNAGMDVMYLDGDTTGMTKDNKVNLTYRYLSHSGTCTCKWQGASSASFPKKNYTIAKLNPAIDVGWGTQNKYVLKADFADASRSRNVVCAKLWGSVVKSRTPVNERLSALSNGGAIDGFPIMLVINGEYQGVYNFTIPKDGWMLGMGDSNTEAIFNSEGGDFKSTVTKEEVLAEQKWEIAYLPDEDNPDWAIDSLNRMLQACVDSTGANYRDTLEDYLDIESAIDYYIYSVLLDNTDGATKNFLMGTYDGIKWFFVAYDLDWTFGSHGYGTWYGSPKSTNGFDAMQGRNRAFHLIYRYDKEALKARYTELRNGALSEDNVMNVIANFTAKIPKALMDEEVKMWPTTPGTMINTWGQMVNWYMLRVKYMDEEIANM